MATMLTIDATALSGVDFPTYITDYFADLINGDYEFFGGEADSFYGSEYYMNGSQVLFSYDESDGGEGSVETGASLIFEGADFAYDFIHYGAAYGHGISGDLDKLIFGEWTESTTGEQGTGAAGEIASFETALSISGFGIEVTEGTGSDDSQMSALFNAATGGDAEAFYDLIAGYGLEVQGSDGDDRFVGGDARDKLMGGAGDDILRGGAGRDLLKGGAGDDVLKGNVGADRLVGGGGDDVLIGGRGDDVLRGGFGNDILTGGHGADAFSFVRGGGFDTITDFTIGEDVIKLRDDLYADFEALSDDILEIAGDAVLTLNNDIVVTLEGVSAADLDASSFLFV